MASPHHDGSANLFQNVGSRWFLAEKRSAFNSIRTQTINGVYINKENNGIIELEINTLLTIYVFDTPRTGLRKYCDVACTPQSHDALVKCSRLSASASCSNRCTYCQKRQLRFASIVNSIPKTLRPERDDNAFEHCSKVVT